MKDLRPHCFDCEEKHWENTVVVFAIIGLILSAVFQSPLLFSVSAIVFAACCGAGAGRHAE